MPDMHIIATDGSFGGAVLPLQPGASVTQHVETGGGARGSGLYVPHRATIIVAGLALARVRIDGMTLYLNPDGGPVQVAVDVSEGHHRVDVTNFDRVACDFHLSLAGQGYIVELAPSFAVADGTPTEPG